ncbi:MAG TPA: low-specificity L-threonine aldolase, partial [Noviherbaspirillum sp.]|nr:low-specificity L-threonine aldolase [Noviherbaspirillum sp.]
RLAEDHANARLLADGLAEAASSHPKLKGRVTAHAAQTNIVFFDVDADIAEAFLQHLADHDVRVTAGYFRAKARAMKRMRWVTHLDVHRADVERALQVVAGF